jgi:serine protease Do
MGKVVLAVLLLTAAIAAAGSNSGPPSSSPPANARRTPLVELVERVRAAVVNIHSERTVQGPASDDMFSMTASQHRVNGMGTGIVIDPRGYIITNQHVVEDVNVIRVRLADGGNFNARVLARDGESDLALLKIETSKPLSVIPFGTATDLMVGEPVVAIGNAYGYEHTVTQGIVSAIKRDVTLNKDVSYKSLIQTDAAINPGNSGGPLLNINGDLIGVNVAIRAGAQGIGFAIPVDTMLRVTTDMMSIRKRNGMTHGLICRDRVDVGQQPPLRSLVVERADATGPAAIQKGDVLLQVAETPITCALELERSLLDRRAGDRVPVIVKRNGEDKQAELVLQSADKAPLAATEVIWRKLGLRLAPASADSVTQGNQHLHGGLTVSEISADGVAGKAGIQRGDILVGLHQWETVTVDNVNFVLTHPDLPSFNPLRFYIVRNGQVHRGWLQQVE